MSKTRRKTRLRPRTPLPPIGSYVLLFQAPDGSLHDPPVPLDQRLTDDELKEVVQAVHAKLKARGDAKSGVTLNRSDELPGGVKLEPANAEERSLCFAGPVPSVDEIAQRLGLPGIDPGERFKARDDASLREYREEFFNKDGSPKHPIGDLRAPTISVAPAIEEIDDSAEDLGLTIDRAQPSLDASRAMPQASKAAGTDESWGKAILTVCLQGFCIVAGSLLAGASVIVGGWAAIKFLASI